MIVKVIESSEVSSRATVTVLFGALFVYSSGMSWFDPSAWVPDVMGQPTATNDGAVAVVTAKPPRTRKDSDKKGSCTGVCGPRRNIIS